MVKLERGLYSYKNEHDACGIGFLTQIKGKKTHDLVVRALIMLERLSHRGASGCEENTGDGAGILVQKPHFFFQKNCAKWSISLPKNENDYAVGMIYLNPNEQVICKIQDIFNKLIKEEHQILLGWRKVRTNNQELGITAIKGEPATYQVFVKKGNQVQTQIDFERKLYLIRKQAEQQVKQLSEEEKSFFYVVSFSSQTIVYKGMLLAEQVQNYYLDLQSEDFISAVVLVHSRFSTNTFPSWKRAHPNRFLVHNGEINTIRGNTNWMKARESQLATKVFGRDIKKIFPLLDEDGSDSAVFDNCLEFLVLSGFSLSHALCLMVPEPWEFNKTLHPTIRSFYHYNSCLMEPWDGPASLSVTDGRKVVSAIDRNGLRPSRYWITEDDIFIMSSEVGIYDVDSSQVKEKGHLEPGKIIEIDTSKGKISFNDEIKLKLAESKPYQKWLNENLINMDTIRKTMQEKMNIVKISEKEWRELQKAFNYTSEECLKILVPMIDQAKDPLASMGSDIPLAVLSDKSQLLYNYFKQLFAQVTNPPIDAIREVIVTSTQTFLGSQGNLLELSATHCQLIELEQPIIGNEDFFSIQVYTKSSKNNDLVSQNISILLEASSSSEILEESLNRIFKEVDRAIDKGSTILILTDRGVNKNLMAIPALLVVASVHHHLLRKGQRTRVSLLLETAEAREVHHFATLIGYGCDVINPYLAIETIQKLVENKQTTVMDKSIAVKNYLNAAKGGITKVLSKMGISTVASYKGAQIFEAVGVKQTVIDKYFTGTSTSIGGIGLDIIACDTYENHQQAFGKSPSSYLQEGGRQSWRKEGEYHLFNPVTIHMLQKACVNNDAEAFKIYSNYIDEHEKNHSTLRSLLEFTKEKKISLEEVESVESIMKRFKTGAMSYGSISAEAHEGLAIAMNRIGGKSNTGEGGEDPKRFIKDSNGDSRRSSIKQVASGRFGVTSHYLTNADEIQIKIAQGAKPGEGGQLPGKKVFPWIAEVRGSTPGVELISPPPHHDVYSIEDLAQLIYDLKNANRNARINVKLVSEVGVGTIAAGVTKCKADVILISGYDGGTGAAPQTSIYHTGLPWELGLSETHQTLVLNGLRNRVTLETDGQLKTGRDVAIAALLGAEEFGFATAPLVVMGCIMMRKCHLGTCPVGIATQDPKLREKFTGDPTHVVHFMHFIAEDLRKIMAELGFRTINEMIGRVDKLKQIRTDHPKMKGIDLSKILYQPPVKNQDERFCVNTQNHLLEKSLDVVNLLKDCQPAIKNSISVELSYPICNTDRSVATILGNEVTKYYGKVGLPENTIQLYFKGSAGQSFGAFIPKGISLSLEGDANDYVGKGLSGGIIKIFPDKKSPFDAEKNTIVGNVVLYGASSGEAYFRGIAGERFAIRNSGATVVVEGLGANGCEYMTGGCVVVLGSVGVNFAAGMSGGLAYIWDFNNNFKERCNLELVELFSMEEGDLNFLKEIIEKHVAYTQSSVGQRLLNFPDLILKQFIKVYPRDYRRVIEMQKKSVG